MPPAVTNFHITFINFHISRRTGSRSADSLPGMLRNVLHRAEDVMPQRLSRSYRGSTAAERHPAAWPARLAGRHGALSGAGQRRDLHRASRPATRSPSATWRAARPANWWPGIAGARRCRHSRRKVEQQCGRPEGAASGRQRKSRAPFAGAGAAQDRSSTGRRPFAVRGCESAGYGSRVQGFARRQPDRRRARRADAGRRPDTATPLSVIVRRAKIRHGRRNRNCPIRSPIRCSTSASIRRPRSPISSKAGDFIQIIDVDGRQCTDFQCFSARKLDKGRDHPLDVTTTRTLMGASYPMPGLHSKYYDQDMEPLVEVVQDTCGRHDAFALACAAKYYDDIGYPGHVNCSENFNGALADKGVAPRAGWMAINFFFNTGDRRAWRHRFRRAVVAAGRLCADAGDDRHRLRLLRLPRRHDAGQWLGPDRHPCAHLFRPAEILASDRHTHDARCRAEDDPRDRLPFELCQSTRAISSNTGATGWPTPSPRKGRSRNTGPAARTRWSWTCRRCASSRSPARIPRRCCNTR